MARTTRKPSTCSASAVYIHLSEAGASLQNTWPKLGILHRRHQSQTRTILRVSEGVDRGTEYILRIYVGNSRVLYNLSVTTCVR
jgi:hypothetical protein